MLNRLSIASLLLLTACGGSSELGYSGISAPSVSVVPVDTESALIEGIEFLQTASDITVLVEEKIAAAEVELETVEMDVDRSRFEASEEPAKPAMARVVRRDTTDIARTPDARISDGPKVDVSTETVKSVSLSPMIAINKVIRRNAGQVSYCHGVAKTRYSRVSGRVELAWTVSEGGVKDVRIVSNTTGDELMAACVLSKVSTMSFPEEIEQDVRHPFVFQES